MRISFDLDDTLICYGTGTPCESRPSWIWRFLDTGEPLRLGTRSLTAELQRFGWELWVYTTSYRNPTAVWLWLWSYGIRVGRVINQQIHDKHLRRSLRDYPPSKNPKAFGIDLHVDDSEGVRMEGDQHGFPVVVVSPSDRDWAEKVMSAAEEVARGLPRD